MKKTIALLLSALLIIALFAGCGSSQSAPAAEEAPAAEAPAEGEAPAAEENAEA